MFTFGFFLDFLALIALTAYVEDEQIFQKVTVPESVVLLLERMELSRGFSNFEEKMHRTHSSASSLLPPNHIIQLIIKGREKENTGDVRKSEQTTRSSQVLWNHKKAVILEDEAKQNNYDQDFDPSGMINFLI